MRLSALPQTLDALRGLSARSDARRSRLSLPGGGEEGGGKRGSWSSCSLHSLRRSLSSDAEWRTVLSHDEFRVLRRRGSEAPYSGKYDNFYPQVGHFKCRACDSPLYSAKAKFDSRTGYPSFDQCYAGRVAMRREFGWRIRTAVRCAECGGHVGHVFEGEWLSATNERHSVNSIAIVYDPNPCDLEEECVRSGYV